MEIKISQAGNFTELKLLGRLDSNTSQILEKDLLKLIQDGNKNLLINFEELNYISSSGLRVFLAGAKLLNADGKKLKLCCMKDYIKEVFEIAGFSIIFEIYNTKEEAIS